MKYFTPIILLFLVSCTTGSQHTMDSLSNEKIVNIYLDEMLRKEIPKEIGELENTLELTILPTNTQGNWEVYPPISWYETRELKEPFTQLPESIGQMSSLESLRLANLDIHVLPESISELKNLEFLDLSMNKLELSKEIHRLSGLPNLKHLKVPGNDFNEEEMKEFQRRNPHIKVEYKSEELPNQR